MKQGRQRVWVLLDVCTDDHLSEKNIRKLDVFCRSSWTLLSQAGKILPECLVYRPFFLSHIVSVSLSPSLYLPFPPLCTRACVYLSLTLSLLPSVERIIQRYYYYGPRGAENLTQQFPLTVRRPRTRGSTSQLDNLLLPT